MLPEAGCANGNECDYGYGHENAITLANGRLGVGDSHGVIVIVVRRLLCVQQEVPCVLCIRKKALITYIHYILLLLESNPDSQYSGTISPGGSREEERQEIMEK